MRLLPFLIVASLATTIGPLAAQAPDSLWRAALVRLTPGATVRLQSRDRGRIEGRLVGTSGTALDVETGTTRTEWSTATIDSFWVRRTHVKTGAIIGAISGAVAGGVMGAMANEIACKDDGGDPCPEAIPLLGFAGAAAGGLLGGVVGSLIHNWQRRVP